MNDLTKLLKTLSDIDSTTLTESAISECPPEMAASTPTNPGNPVTVSVTMNASGKDHVSDLLSMMKNAGLGDAAEVKPDMMPMRTDMERLRGIVDAPNDDPEIPGKDDDMQDGALVALGGAAAGDKITDEDLEEYDNEPDEEYQDHKYMTKDLSGGLNREKKQYAKSQDGDNAMAVESIKNKLYAALSEKIDTTNEISNKKLKSYAKESDAKPDFADLDKDGDKKEPMKKAAKDAKKNKTDESIVERDIESNFENKHRDINNLGRKMIDMSSKSTGTDDNSLMLSNALSRLGDVLAEFGGNGFVANNMNDVIKKTGMSKLLIQMLIKKASQQKKETAVDEISSDLAKRYTKAAKMDRDFNDDDLAKLPNKVRHGTDDQAKQASADMSRLQRRNSKRQKGINTAKKRMQ